jgi:hypothetical protein
MLKIPAGIKKYRRQNSDISRQVSPTSLLGVSVGICHRARVGESGMIRTQMGKQNRSDLSQCMVSLVRYHLVTTAVKEKQEALLLRSIGRDVQNDKLISIWQHIRTVNSGLSVTCAAFTMDSWVLI